jgi:transposase
VIADAAGRALGFVLAPGQAHELPLAPTLLALLTFIPLWIIGDRGYAARVFRALIRQIGSHPAIPAKRNEAAVDCPSWIYTHRNRVERLWSRLKEWRAVATRYEKTAQSFMGVLCLAATLDRLKR